MSVATINSKATADTLAGSIIAPPFKFGKQVAYKNIGDFEISKQQLKRDLSGGL
jgi:hypothetical protein